MQHTLVIPKSFREFVPQQASVQRTFTLAVLTTVFKFALGPRPLPRGVPGEGPERHVLEEIGGFGPAPARIRGAIYILFLFWPQAQLD